MKNRNLQESYQYIESLLPRESDLHLQAREAANTLGLAHISISPVEANLVYHLIKMNKCKKFVEIGCLTGLSGVYILQALGSNGMLWTFEKDFKHAELAKPILERACLNSGAKFEIILGDAQQTLATINHYGPFDGIFIDGNKAAYSAYLEWAQQNIKTGGLIIADNVFLRGGVWGRTESNFSEKQIKVMQEFNNKLCDQKLFETFFIPTSEGLSVSRKK